MAADFSTGHEGGRSPAFPPTRRSAVAAVGSDDPAERARSFDVLVRAYWMPVYKHVRLKWNRPSADAGDLTQGFFARAFEKRWLADYQRDKALFRTYLKTCLDRYVMESLRDQNRHKRGGDAVRLSLDFDFAEEELARSGAPSAAAVDAVFDAEWTRSLLTAAVAALEAACAAQKKETYARVFRRYVLDGDDAGPRPSYATIAEELGITVKRRDELPRLDATRVPPARARGATGDHRHRRGVAKRGSRRARDRSVTVLDDRAVAALRALVREPGPGDVLGDRFELREVIGEGGMGVVHAAFDRETSREVAVKVVRGEGSDDARFARECAALAGVAHPAIVPYVARGTHEGVHWLAMDRLVGSTLASTLHRDGKLGIADTLALGRRVAEALAAAHRQRIAHRDVKPSNLFLVDGAPAGVRLLDFGIARDLAAPPLTKTGTLVGTPGYMAPEQARGERATPAADVFALGCVLFECLVGRPAFTGTTTEVLLAQILLEVPPLVPRRRN